MIIMHYVEYDDTVFFSRDSDLTSTNVSLSVHQSVTDQYMKLELGGQIWPKERKYGMVW